MQFNAVVLVFLALSTGIQANPLGADSWKDLFSRDPTEDAKMALQPRVECFHGGCNPCKNGKCPIGPGCGCSKGCCIVG